MHSTNFTNTLITPAPDSDLAAARLPAKQGSIADLQYRLLKAQPYLLTSDDLLFKVAKLRKIASDRDAFFARPQACLRTSPLAKSHGFALHHDSQSRVALVPVESDSYAALMADDSVAKTPAMRSKRA
jgi:hypothetical protein